MITESTIATHPRTLVIINILLGYLRTWLSATTSCVTDKKHAQLNHHGFRRRPKTKGLSCALSMWRDVSAC